jgi:hypothetical protein
LLSPLLTKCRFLRLPTSVFNLLHLLLLVLAAFRRHRLLLVEVNFITHRHRRLDNNSSSNISNIMVRLVVPFQELLLLRLLQEEPCIK